MININLAIRQKENEEADSYLLQIGNTNGLWHCVIKNNDLPLNKYSTHKDSLEELVGEIENYINKLGIVINYYQIEVPEEIKNMLLRLKGLNK
jgi:hypothetical protein